MSNPSFQGPEAYQEIKKPSMQKFFQPRGGGKIDNGAAKEEEGKGVDRKKDVKKEKEVQVASTPNTDEVAQDEGATPRVPSSATKAEGTKETMAPSPDSIHKRKLPASPSSASNKKLKKERPAYQPDIASFFSKKKE